MKFDTSAISRSLNMTSLGVIDIEFDGTHDHRHGGWELVNNNPKVKAAATKRGGKKRRNGLIALNRSERKRMERSIRNVDHNRNNKFALGYKHSAEGKKRISNNNGARGCKWMNDGSVTERVSAMQIYDRLNNGWQFGRL